LLVTLDENELKKNFEDISKEAQGKVSFVNKDFILDSIKEGKKLSPKDYLVVTIQYVTSNYKTFNVAPEKRKNEEEDEVKTKKSKSEVKPAPVAVNNTTTTTTTTTTATTATSATNNNGDDLRVTNYLLL
jgi:hypothetical protein